MQYSLNVLKRRATEKSLKNEKLIGGLAFDEVKIHKLVQWIDNKMIGYENVPGIDPKSASVASEALVFMFVGVNDNLQLPVAYYYTNTLDAEMKTEVLENVIRAILKCENVVLTSLTFDGFSTNQKACEILGANLKVSSDTFNPTVTVQNCELSVILDPSHMIKLVRGIISNQKVLYNSKGEKIEWSFFEELVKFSHAKFFWSMHKLRQAHINWRSDPMKVILAVQTLGGSTANAIEFLMNQGHRQFTGANATVEFIRTWNDLFSALNSTYSSVSNKDILKRPISADNIVAIRELFGRAVEYIKGLKLKTAAGNIVPLCTNDNKTGFVGAIFNMHSVLKIYSIFVDETNSITKFPVHTLSQDHLEVLFGKLRALNGSNNNPTCQQTQMMSRCIIHIPIF